VSPMSIIKRPNPS